jgi:hypothetical protein
MTLHNENSQSSEITSWQPLASAVGSRTGEQHGAIGLGKPLRVSANLAKMDPAETDQRLVDCLERTSGQRLGFQVRMICPNIGPVYEVISRVAWPVYGEQASAMLDIIAGSFKAAPHDVIGAEIYRLRTMTRGREQRDPADREAEAAIWIEKLRCYPGDIVVSVLQGWPSRTNGMWWPTWSEVDQEIRKLSDKRMSLLNHVRRMEKRTDPALMIEQAEEDNTRREEAIETVKSRWGEHWGIAGIIAEVKRDEIPSPELLAEKYGSSPLTGLTLSEDALNGVKHRLESKS